MLKSKSMADNTPTPVEQALSIIDDAKNDVCELLKDHDMVKTSMIAKFDIMANQLRMMLGANLPSTVGASSKQTFPPVTDFMGDSIKTAKDVTVEDMNISDLELTLFREKVDQLQADFPQLSNDQILDSYKTQPNVVRGVAKRAGLTEYRTAEINTDTLDLVREGLKAQAQLQADKQAADKATQAAKAPSAPATNADLDIDDEDEEDDEDTDKR